jgi:hypothetical protein
LPADQIGRQLREPIVLSFRSAIFDYDVLARDVAGFLQALEKSGATSPLYNKRCRLASAALRRAMSDHDSI